MSGDPSEPRPAEAALRFEATIHPGEAGASLEGVADLDLDRVPDPGGDVRMVVTPDDAAQLVAKGYEVRLVRALPVRPLDPARVLDDDGARAWLDQQTQGIERREDS